MRQKIYTLCLLVWLSTNVVWAQEKASIFREDQPITWLGLDFSAATFIGDNENFQKTDDAIPSFIERLNDLMVDEQEKYDIRKNFRKENVKLLFKYTEHQNSLLKPEMLLADNLEGRPAFSAEMVKEIVATYDFEDEKGIGLMFIIESLNKEAEKGTMWVTFVNLETNEVIITERVTEEPGGFGLRNYWAGFIYRSLKEIYKKDYTRWRAKYSG